MISTCSSKKSSVAVISYSELYNDFVSVVFGVFSQSVSSSHIVVEDRKGAKAHPVLGTRLDHKTVNLHIRWRRRYHFKDIEQRMYTNRNMWLQGEIVWLV